MGFVLLLSAVASAVQQQPPPGGAVDLQEPKQPEDAPPHEQNQQQPQQQQPQQQQQQQQPLRLGAKAQQYAEARARLEVRLEASRLAAARCAWVSPAPGKQAERLARLNPEERERYEKAKCAAPWRPAHHLRLRLGSPNAAVPPGAPRTALGCGRRRIPKSMPATMPCTLRCFSSSSAP